MEKAGIILKIGQFLMLCLRGEISSFSDVLEPDCLLVDFSDVEDRGFGIEDLLLGVHGTNL